MSPPRAKWPPSPRTMTARAASSPASEACDFAQLAPHRDVDRVQLAGVRQRDARDAARIGRVATTEPVTSVSPPRQARPRRMKRCAVRSASNGPLQANATAPRGGPSALSCGSAWPCGPRPLRCSYFRAVAELAALTTFATLGQLHESVHEARCARCPELLRSSAPQMRAAGTRPRLCSPPSLGRKPTPRLEPVRGMTRACGARRPARCPLRAVNPFKARLRCPAPTQACCRTPLAVAVRWWCLRRRPHRGRRQR